VLVKASRDENAECWFKAVCLGFGAILTASAGECGRVQVPGHEVRGKIPVRCRTRYKGNDVRDLRVCISIINLRVRVKGIGSCT
jgi:hypothetical protein